MAEYICELPVDGMVSFVSGNTTIPVYERIVRCRNCERAFEHDCGHLYCGRRPGSCFEVHGDDFCSRGVSKEEK